jgi:hypothetical protein
MVLNERSGTIAKGRQCDGPKRTGMKFMRLHKMLHFGHILPSRLFGTRSTTAALTYTSTTSLKARAIFCGKSYVFSKPWGRQHLCDQNYAHRRYGRIRIRLGRHPKEAVNQIATSFRGY